MFAGGQPATSDLVALTVLYLQTMLAPLAKVINDNFELRL
jgi:hypothetical protein